MKKIYLSVLAIALTLGAVSGTAYALFSDSVTVSGITLQAGSADLQIKRYPMSDYGSSASFTDWWSTFEDDPLYPGWGVAGDKCASFYLRNRSNGNFGLDLKAQLNAFTEDPTGSWNLLKDVVKLGLKKEGSALTWKTLNQWNTEAVSFDGTLAKDMFGSEYKICVQIPTDAVVDNSYSGKALRNVGFSLTGTQHVTP